MVRHAAQILTWLREPPPELRRGPFRADAFPSAVRSVRLTSLLGVALGAAFAVCFLTGLLSHLIQHPPSWFWWPSRPAGLYRVTQGLHVATGLASVPLLIAKLWSVYPRLFSWPPVPSAAGAIERLGLVALVGGSLFQVVSGVLNIYRVYGPMPFFFTAAHWWVAWLTIGGLLAHIGVKLPLIRAALSRRAATDPAVPDRRPTTDAPVAGRRAATDAPALRTQAATDTAVPDQRAATDTAVPDLGTGTDAPVPGRRALLAGVGAAAGLITLGTAGQTVAPLSPVSVLAPRHPHDGPQRVPVNRTAAAAGVRDAAMDPGYRLRLAGATTRMLSVTDLAALPQHTVVLPIACVEGWSSTGTWTGVRLRDLAELAGIDPEHAEARVESMQTGGRYRESTVAAPHLRDPDTLIALRLNGAPLHPDHGYPARLIAPSRPGVLQTKWVGRITVRSLA